MPFMSQKRSPDYILRAARRRPMSLLSREISDLSVFEVDREAFKFHCGP